MKAKCRRPNTADKLEQLLRLHPGSKVICVSSGLLSREIKFKRSLRAVGYAKELNTIVIEYYE